MQVDIRDRAQAATALSRFSSGNDEEVLAAAISGARHDGWREGLQSAIALLQEDYRRVWIGDVDAALDQGIAPVVSLLQAEGFHTTDSGDGVSKPEEERTVDGPHVVATTEPAALCAEAERMAAVLGSGWVIEASYSTADRLGVLVAIQSMGVA